MDFENLIKKISPRLQKIASVYHGRSFSDGEDLYQEMCMHLWKNFKDGLPAGINESYIVQGCKFHILNVLRKEREKTKILSLDESFNEEGVSLKDSLPDGKESPEVISERKIIIDKIRNNGLSRKEKEVLSYLLDGFSVRGIGKIMGISHVMVIKYKKNLIEKCQREIRVTGN